MNGVWVVLAMLWAFAVGWVASWLFFRYRA
jgi:hypothetical protein